MIALVLRIFSNPIANALQKTLTNRGVSALVVIRNTHFLLSLACAPALFYLPHARTGFWLPIVIASMLAVSSNTLLVAALSRSDLSILGPINAYKPLVSLLPSVILLREFPTALTFAGMLLIVVGSYLILDPAPSQGVSGRSVFRLLADRGVQLRLAALVLSATEAPFLKRAATFSSPSTTFAWWCLLGFLLAVPFSFRSRGSSDPRRMTFSLFCLLALATGTMQLTTLMTFSHLPVPSSLALFQISTLLTVLLGHSLFQEPYLVRRLFASGVMGAGAALILLGR